MRLTLLLVAGLTGLTGAAWEPQPKLDGVTVTLQSTTLSIRGWFRSPGQPDSNITTLAVTGGASQRHALLGTVWQDVFTVARPLAGVTLTGSFCVQSKRVGWGSAAPVCRSWSYAEPAVLPPPVVDSVKTDTLIVAVHILPTGLRPIALQAPADTLVCAVYVMGNASVGYRGPRSPACEGYPGLPISAAGQAKLDRECTSWTVRPIDPQGRTLAVVPTEPCAGLARVVAR